MILKTTRTFLLVIERYGPILKVANYPLNLLIEASLTQNIYNNNSNEASLNWKKFWKTNLPLMVLFCWKYIKKCIPVYSLPHSELDYMNKMCPICHIVEEYMEHALFYRDHATATWLIAFAPASLHSHFIPENGLVDRWKSIIADPPLCRVRSSKLDRQYTHKRSITQEKTQKFTWFDHRCLRPLEKESHM